MGNLRRSMISREVFPLPLPAALPDGLSNTASRQVRSRQRAKRQRRQWETDVVQTLNSLQGYDSEVTQLGSSAAHTEALQRVEATVAAAGPPPCSPVAAFVELRGHSPGYILRNPRLVSHSRRSLSPCRRWAPPSIRERCSVARLLDVGMDGETNSCGRTSPKASLFGLAVIRP